MHKFLFLFLLFMTYSFIGWVIEMIVCSIFDKKVVNRGFLVGPYCPIYGVSALLMDFFLKKYLNDAFILFIMAIVICSITEYITSFIMEKLFKARWWDYSDKPFNVNGRICLTNSVCFGVLGALLLYVLNPFFISLIKSLPNIIFYVLSLSILTIFIVDVVTSFNIIRKLKLTVDTVRKDYTEEITSKVKEVIFKKSILSRRLISAFPNIKFKIPFSISRKK